MTIAGALSTLLDVVARDSEARHAEILGAAQAQAEALHEASMREARPRLRSALRAERARGKARIAAARAHVEAEQRRALQRQATLAVAAAETLLPAALQAAWNDPQRRRQWLEQALARAAQSLPRGAWRIRHGHGLGADDKAWLQRHLGELGLASVSFEANAGIDAGIEIDAGATRLEATPAGLLADRTWVYGRLLHLLDDAPAEPSQGGAAKPMEPRSGEPPSTPAPGRGQGGG
ncbi:MAG: hypothetical protein D4R84_09505 [Rhodocyclaceae bacterium]|nr:MAG: hypothetical protein D4R84_09505 [Rhodocyclaceae bacterium]